jgi:protein-L-isoaspartate(D-aspartate) O-methyltransferase
MIDAAEQRTNMVESQVMPSDVTDRRILQAMGSVPRERFVPPVYATLAYMDEAVPLAVSGTPRGLMPPRALAKLLQLADVAEKDRVLNVGAGSGYSAAVLAGMARSVVALECDSTLADEMRKTLGSLTIGNVSVVLGELADGWPADGPYDVVLLDGSIAERPQALLEQLKDGGRLVGIVKSGGMGKATIWRRLGRSFDSWTAFDAAAPTLPGFEPVAIFAL